MKLAVILTVTIALVLIGDVSTKIAILLWTLGVFLLQALAGEDTEKSVEKGKEVGDKVKGMKETAEKTFDAAQEHGSKIIDKIGIL